MAQITPTSLTRYRSALAQITPMEDTEEADLAHRWRAGDRRAGQRLVEGNLATVLRIAYEYRRWGVPLEDLVQQGNLGLLQAARRFEPGKGNRLATYAGYWIRAEIREYVVRMYRIVRLGTTRTERRAVRTYRAKAIASAEELARESGMPEARCQQLWPLLTQPDASLTPPPSAVGVGRAATLEDPMPDPESLAAEREEKARVDAAVQAALGALSDREQHILWARFMSEQPCTLEQLGCQLGVSRERVRQLEMRARSKVRDALEAHVLPAA